MVIALTLEELVLISCIVLAAFVVRAVTGFGSGIILAPLLSFVMDIKQVVVATTILHLAAGLFLLLTSYRDIDYKELRAVGVVSVLFCAGGSFLLSTGDSELLLGVFGLLTIGYAVAMLIRPQLRIVSTNSRFSALSRRGLGALSGLLHGLYGTGGPPVIMLFSNNLHEKASFRSTLIAYFLILDVVRGALYLAPSTISDTSPLLSSTELQLGLLMLAPTAVGTVLGNWIQARITKNVFRRAVAFTLLAAGLMIVAKLI